MSKLLMCQSGLTSARRSTILPFGGSQALLTDGVAAQLQREKSAQAWILAGRTSALVAFPAKGVAAVPAPQADDYAPNEHTGNGGSRGPHPWRRPPVII